MLFPGVNTQNLPLLHFRGFFAILFWIQIQMREGNDDKKNTLENKKGKNVSSTHSCGLQTLVSHHCSLQCIEIYCLCFLTWFSFQDKMCFPPELSLTFC